MKIALGMLAAPLLVSGGCSSAQAQGMPQGTHHQAHTNASVQGNMLFATRRTSPVSRTPRSPR